MKQNQTTNKRVKKTDEYLEPHTIIAASTKPIREVNGVRYQSVFDQVAQDKFFYKNWLYPGSREAFPEARDDFRYVSRFYPYADGGPLAFDEADRNWQKDETFKQLTEIKKDVLKKHGIRYVIVGQGATELEVLEQLA